MIARRESAVLGSEVNPGHHREAAHPPGATDDPCRSGPFHEVEAGCFFCLRTLGVTKTHSRPHIRDDNPYSEAQFKTLKYRPDFHGAVWQSGGRPGFLPGFFPWYNMEHHHSGVALMTPHVLHYGLAKEAFEARQRFYWPPMKRIRRGSFGSPGALPLPQAAWINPPKPAKESENLLH